MQTTLTAAPAPRRRWPRRLQQARLVIAKIDRLVQHLVMAYLKKLGDQFVAYNNPLLTANNYILVAVAADEGRRISLRTRDAPALQAGPARLKRIRAMHPDGVPAEVVAHAAGRLGRVPQRRNLTDEDRAKGAGPPEPPTAPGRPGLGHCSPGCSSSIRRTIARRHCRGPQRRGAHDSPWQALEQDPGQTGPRPGPAGLNGQQ